MFVTKEEFKTIENLANVLCTVWDFVAMPKELQDAITAYDMTLMHLIKKKKASNKKTAEYIAEKRKSDKNYARSKKEE